MTSNLSEKECGQVPMLRLAQLELLYVTTNCPENLKVLKLIMTNYRAKFQRSSSHNLHLWQSDKLAMVIHLIFRYNRQKVGCF